MTDKQKVQWLQPYTKKLADGSLRLGIDITAHYTVKAENIEGYQADNQLTWLAVMYANQLIDYALSDVKTRQKTVHTTDGNEQISKPE